MNDVACMFSDGGLTDTNGTEGLRGVYTWVHVDCHDEYVRHETGMVEPHHVLGKRIENNNVELVALLRGLRALPDGWSGTVYCDNRNALEWTFGKQKQDGVPDLLKAYIIRQKARLGRIDRVLLGGHPTIEDLARGRRPDGKPVHRWNAFADSCCNAQKILYARSIGMTPEQANKKYHMKPEDYARLMPEMVDALRSVGYPLGKATG